MQGLNSAWWIAVGIGVILLAIDFLLPAKKKKKAGKYLVVIGLFCIAIGVVGLIYEYRGGKAMATTAPIQQPTQPSDSGAKSGGKEEAPIPPSSVSKGKKNVPPHTPAPRPSIPTTYSQDCKDSACAQGPDSTATYNKYGVPKPPPNMAVLSTQPLAASSSDMPSAAYQGRGFDHPGLIVKFHSDALFVTPMFLVRCDHPCIASMIRFSDKKGTSFSGNLDDSLHDTDDKSVVWFGAGNKTLLTPDTTVTITVRSRDSEPINSATVEGYVQ